MNWMTTGSVLMFVGVALGAFGAHGLRAKLTPELLQIFETGVRYQIYHALALLAVAWLADKSTSPFIAGAGWLFFLGVILFSGSLYLYALTAFKPLVFLTPVGGLLFLGGWLCVIVVSLAR